LGRFWCRAKAHGWCQVSVSYQETEDSGKGGVRVVKQKGKESKNQKKCKMMVMTMMIMTTMTTTIDGAGVGSQDGAKRMS
jgi:hypothetical protein